MTMTMKKTLGVLVAVALVGCGDIDVQDLNNPPEDQLVTAPTRAGVLAASTGLIIGSREGLAAQNGYVSQLGILGREAYNFDAADPRYIQEMLESPKLDPGSPAFGGNFWAAPYRNLKHARILLAALDNPVLQDVTDAEKQAIRGFVNTMSALDYLQIITTRDSEGAVDAHGTPDAKGLYPLVSKDAIYDRIVDLLDKAHAQLAAGGKEFPFKPLPTGFASFDKPATFAQFNRALRARVAAYRQDWEGVLTALGGSFIDDQLTAENAATKLKTGVYFNYSGASGDSTNGLNARVLYAHPSIFTAQEKNSESGANDARVTAIVTIVEKPGTARGLSSVYKYTKYTTTSPLPIIRNEELILLRAEALIGRGEYDKALEDLNRIRVYSGKLTPLEDGTLDANNAVDQLLKQRRYSLLFEGGHSWIDFRRYGKLSELPLDTNGVAPHYHVSFFPIPVAETDARK